MKAGKKTAHLTNGDLADALQEAMQQFSIRRAYVGELNSVSESWTAVDDFALEGKFGLLQPKSHPEPGSYGEWYGHLNETATHAEVGGFAPDRCTDPVWLKLHRIQALHASMLTPVRSGQSSEGIDSSRGEWQIPHRLFRREVHHTDLAGPWSAGLAHPFHVKARLVTAMADADNLARLNFRDHATEFRAGPAYVYGHDILGKYTPACVGPVDPDRNGFLRSWFPAFTHE